MLPVEASAILAIGVLGNLNPPGHTQPSDHIGIYLPTEVPLMAPADGVITDLRRTTLAGSDDSWSDAALSITLCPGRELKFGHVTTVSDDLFLRLGDPDNCEDTYDGYVICGYFGKEVAVSAGQQIGTTGRSDVQPAALDIWALDWTAPEAPFIYRNPNNAIPRFSVCPLDWFAEDLRTLLYDATTYGTGVPLEQGVGCGSIAQDVPGTAKGLWYLAAGRPGEWWSDQLALVDDNRWAIKQVISVASTLADPGVWVFERRHEGTVNRDFAEVGAGMGRFCYEDFDSRPADDSYLLEVVDDETLFIERLSGGCAGDPRFVSPVEYRRHPQ